MKHTWKLRLTSGALALMLLLGTPVGAQDDPASAALRAQFPELHDAIWSIPTADTVAKQSIVALWQTTIEMAAPEVGGAALTRIFGISATDVMAQIAADPAGAANLAFDKFGTGLAEDAAVSASAALLADLVLSMPVAQDLSPEFRTVLAALIRAIVEESYFVYKGLKDPSEIVSGLVNRAFDVYQIARATGEVVDAQRSALLANAQAVELAAQLAYEVATESARARAMEIVTETQDIVAEMVGRDDAEAVREIVNLTFIALLSQRRGDLERARSFAQRILDTGAEADNIGPFSAMIRPVDWLTAIAREDFRDAPAEAAFVMVSTTSLRLLFADTVADTEPTLPASDTPSPIADDDWGPAVVANDLGYWPCGEQKTEDACLRALGLSDMSIAFSYALDDDYSGSSIAISFSELGPVDLAVAQFTGASTHYFPVFLNGTLGFQAADWTADLGRAFQDGASRAMLSRFPQAANIAMEVRSHRLLPDGTQRFTLVETISDACRACDILGSAVTFLEIGPATGGQLVRRPVGLLLGDPDDSEDMTPDLLRTRPESLQVALNALGYDAGPMDGDIGRRTREALSQFQAEQCLPATGTLDPETATRLVVVDGLDQPPCAGAQLPISTGPLLLLNGTYAFGETTCDAAGQILSPRGYNQASFELEGDTVSFGSATCQIDSLDSNPPFYFMTLDCRGGSGSGGYEPWNIEVFSVTSLQAISEHSDVGFPYQLCQPVSSNAMASAEPAGATQAATGLDGLPQGMFSVDPGMCGPLSEEESIAYGDRLYTGTITLEGSQVSWGEANCNIQGVTVDGTDVSLALSCDREGLVERDEMLLVNVSDDGFNRNGDYYSRCGTGADMQMAELELGTYATDPAFCTDPGAAAYGRDIRVIGSDQVDYGINDPCFSGSPVADGSAFEYTAHCPFSEPDYVANWRWRPLSSTAFIEERGLFPDSPDAPWGLQFYRCPDMPGKPILESADLFNLFGSLLSGDCAGREMCNLDLVDGTYELQQIARSQFSADAATSRFLMVYEQGVSHGKPVSAGEVVLSEVDPAYLIRRQGCSGDDCASAVMSVFADKMGGPLGGSGNMGFALEMPVGWNADIVPTTGVEDAASSFGEIEHLVSGLTNQGIVYTMTVGVRRGTDGVLVRLLNAEGGYNAAANFNAIEPDAVLDMGLHVVARADCEDCRPSFVEQAPAAWRFSQRRIENTGLPQDIFISDATLAQTDLVSFALYGMRTDGGLLFLNAYDIPTAILTEAGWSTEAETAQAPVISTNDHPAVRTVTAGGAYTGWMVFEDRWGVTLEVDFTTGTVVETANGRYRECQGTLQFAGVYDAEQIGYTINIPSGRDMSANQRRCSGNATLVLRVTSTDPNADIEAWIVDGDQTLASGTLESLAQEREVEVSRAEAMDPCQTAQWTGVVDNLVDLFACDASRAMAELTDGRQVLITVGDLSFRDGWVYSTMNQRSTFVEETADSMASDGMTGWDQWLSVTQAQTVSVICAFAVDQAYDLPRGASLVVQARLTEYQSSAIVLQCDSPQPP